MNLFLVESSRDLGDGKYLLSEEIAKDLESVSKTRVDAELRVGIQGGVQGVLKSTTWTEEGLLVELKDIIASPNLLPIDVVLAICRPQMLKRVYQSTAAIGVSRLTLVRSHHVQKSYLQSHVLEEEQWLSYSRLGLEQACSTLRPERVVHKDFRSFIRSCSADSIRGTGGSSRNLRLVASPEGGIGLDELLTRGDLREPPSTVTLAIGPERGWDETELVALERMGFLRFCFGQTVLRVEDALTYALGQVVLLRKLLKIV